MPPINASVVFKLDSNTWSGNKQAGQTVLVKVSQVAIFLPCDNNKCLHKYIEKESRVHLCLLWLCSCIASLSHIEMGIAVDLIVSRAVF